MMNGGDRRSADFSRSKDRLKVSTATTAEMLGVGEAQVNRAKRVQREAPEQFEQIKTTTRSRSAAEHPSAA